MHEGRRHRLAGPFALSALLLSSWFATWAGSPPSLAPSVAAPRTPTPAAISSVYCGKCHDEATPSKADPCRLDEYRTWDREDRHRIAWAVLKGPRARRMGDLLNGDGKDIARDERCLACHAGTMPAATVELARPNRYSAEEGVGCVACHGAALEWVAFHSLPTGEWRRYSRERKEAEFGMIDLWDARKRAGLCLSCHLGDRRKGRFVTHEMYAAGHPPLPGIEVASFGDEMPRHWESPGEKARRLEPGAREEATPGLRPDRLARTELVAVGGLVALRRALDQYADIDGSRGRGGGSAPDFARHDCYACHHDIRTSDRSWRQRAGSVGAPGRPRLSPWTEALAPLGLVAADPRQASAREGALERRLAAFHVAVAARPFADGPAVADAAADLARSIDPILDELSRKRTIDRSTALAMLRRLCAMADERIPDYDSARQMAWAFRAIYGDLNPQPAPGDPILDELGRLRDELDLSLRPSLKSTSPRPIAEGEPFHERLRAVADYDPSAFREHFRAMARHLPAS